MSEQPSPLEFLRAVYLNNDLPLTVRMRAAVECAPYVHPKLTAIATTTLNGKDFASMLERAIQRSRAPLVIEHREAERPLPEAPPPGIRGRSGAGR
jgi:hypothetical protein